MDPKRKKILGIVGAAVVLMIAYFSYDFIFFIKTDNAQVEAHALMLAPKVSGFVTAVNVVEGQKVKSGDILAQIDERDFQNALTQFKGDLSSMEAKRKDAERNFKRISELFSKEAVSVQQYDQSSAAWNDVKSKYDAVAAQVSQAQLNLDNAKIKAPTDGFIAKKSIEVGQLAGAGVPLFGFVDSHERWVIANFKETDLEGIKEGNKVDIAVDAIDSKKFTGIVESISAATGATFSLLPPDNATGNFTKVVQRVPVRIKLENLTPEDIAALRAGLSAFVKVHKL